MKRIRLIAAVGVPATIAIASLLFAPTAEAAKGTLIYTGSDGKHHSISSPKDGKCYTIPPDFSPASGFVRNDTSTDAELFTGSATCEGSDVEVIAPGESDPDAKFVAVRFIV